MINKDADQTARMCRLISAFVVRIGQKQVFSERGSVIAVIILKFVQSGFGIQQCAQKM